MGHCEVVNLHCFSERKPNYYCLNKWTVSINAIEAMGFILFQLCLSFLSFCTALKTNSQLFVSVENRCWTCWCRCKRVLWDFSWGKTQHTEWNHGTAEVNGSTHSIKYKPAPCTASFVSQEPHWDITKIPNLKGFQTLPQDETGRTKFQSMALESIMKNPLVTHFS